MTEQHPEHEQHDQTGDDTAAAADAVAAVQRVFDLDEFLSQAQAPETWVSISTRPDIDGQIDRLLEELSGLVDSSGRPVGEEEVSLAEVSRVVELNEQIQALQEQREEAKRWFHLRGLLEEPFSAFQRAQLNPDRTYKNRDEYFNRLLVETLAEPKLTLEQVRLMRSKTTWAQFDRLATAALELCTDSGVDVPKLPPFSVRRPPQES
jgi:hypothetical protein